MTNIEELKTQLQETINITRVIEIKPNSQLLVICKVADSSLPQKDLEYIKGSIEEALKELLEKCFVKILITDFDFELEFYRIDNELG